MCVWTNQSTLSDPACLFQFKGNSGNFFTDGCFLQLAINKQSTDELSLRVLRRKEVYSNRRAQWCQVEWGWYEVKGWAVPRTMQSKWWQGSARWIFISVENWTLIVVDGDRWSKIIGHTLRAFYLAISSVEGIFNDWVDHIRKCCCPKFEWITSLHSRNTP